MNQKLKVKDLVTIGVFAVIYFIVMFVVGMMGMVPILFMIWPFVNGAIPGIIVMFFMAKEQKPWALFIFGIIPPLLMFLMGHTYFMLVHGIVIMFIAEMIRRRGDYKSFRSTAIANGVFSMWVPGGIMQMFVFRERFIEMNMKMMGPEYTDALVKLVTYPNMILVYVGAFVGGLISAYLGKKLLHKHFEKAGIV